MSNRDNSDRVPEPVAQNNEEAVEAAKKFQQVQTEQANSVPEPSENKKKEFSLDFVQPKESVQLPSQGKFYDEGSSLSSGLAEIMQMTAKHEDILTDKNLLKNGLMTNRLVSSLLTEHFPIKEMLTGDKNAIVINSRITAYGPEYEVKAQCSFCGESHKHMFDLREDVHYVTTDYAMNSKEVGLDTDNKTMILTLPETGFEVTAKLMTVADELKVNGPGTQKQSKMVMTKNITDSLRLLIKEVQGETNTAKIAKFVQKMPAKDSRYLRMKYKEYNPNVHIKKEVYCHSCGMDDELEVGLRPEFFWPSS